MTDRAKRRKFRQWLPLWLLALLLLFPVQAVRAQSEVPVVLTIQVDDMITAGTTAQIRRGIQEAEDRQADALVILLNTPGGLVDATLDIVSLMAESRVPVITYVSPQGAIAASAGAFILLGGDVAAMTPGSTTGAAMPVTLSPGEEGTQTADDKTVLFLAGHIRSIAESRDRPGDVAERFVTENLTLSTREALEEGVIDLTAVSLVNLLEETDGMTVTIAGETVMLNTAGAVVESIEKSLTEKMTHLISNPQITFILLLLGVYGLIIGFGNPGTFVPEVMGAIALVLALFGLGMFEINLFAMLLIFLGLGLLVAEALTPTYGVLGTGGVISLVLGILYLPVEPLVARRWLAQFRLMAIGVGAVGAVFLVVLLGGLMRLRRLPVKMGNQEFSQETGVAVTPLQPEGMIQIRGELWKAKTRNNELLPEGTRVRVLERQQLVCLVEPAEVLANDSIAKMADVAPEMDAEATATEENEVK
ncbi:NfeD family protein [Anoxynatronum buryatiense]|nr:nodulation protein NfeD [Anoxynatronum buryatiense]